MPSEPLTRGLPPPNPHSLCPLSVTELVDPPPQTKFLGTPLLQTTVSSNYCFQIFSISFGNYFYTQCRLTSQSPFEVW